MNQVKKDDALRACSAARARVRALPDSRGVIEMEEILGRLEALLATPEPSQEQMKALLSEMIEPLGRMEAGG